MYKKRHNTNKWVTNNSRKSDMYRGPGPSTQLLFGRGQFLFVFFKLKELEVHSNHKCDSNSAFHHKKQSHI